MMRNTCRSSTSSSASRWFAADVEAALFRINAITGVRAQGVFRAGEDVGETELQLAFADGRRWWGGVRMDNHGDRFVGENRAVAQYGYSSLLRPGDEVSLGLMSAFSPSNTNYGWLRYEVPSADLKNRWFAEFGNNAFDWDASDFMVGGESRIAAIGLERVFSESRTQTRAAGASIARHNLTTGEAEDMDLVFLTTQTRLRRVWDEGKVMARGTVSADVGRVSDGALVGMRDRFWRARTQVEAWHLVDVSKWLRWLDTEQTVRVGIEGQMADTRLPDSLRMSLGGPHRVRGYTPGRFVADQAAVVRLDLDVTPVKWSEVGSLKFFFDAAVGRSRGPFADSASVSSAGLGFDWHLTRQVSSEITLAVPLTENVPDVDPDTVDDGSVLYWTFTYAP